MIASQIKGRTIVAFTFHEGGYWNYLGAPLKASAIADDDPTNNLVWVGIEGAGREKKWFVPAAVILDNGRLYDNILNAFDDSIITFDMKEKLLKNLQIVKERIENEYPGSRRGPEAV